MPGRTGLSSAFVAAAVRRIVVVEGPAGFAAGFTAGFVVDAVDTVEGVSASGFATGFATGFTTAGAAPAEAAGLAGSVPGGRTHAAGMPGERSDGSATDYDPSATPSMLRRQLS